MSPSAFPPTPASSTDIQGRDGSKQLTALQTSFELPPPALAAANGDASSPAVSPTDAVDANSMSPLVAPEYPVQAAEAVKSRRRSAAAVAVAAAAKNAFALPPPPTRSRTIIQMKPGGVGAAAVPLVELRPTGKSSSAATVSGAAAVPAPATAASTATAATAASKRKQPSSTSAAGRKIARKTAHSLIERRRRSKMNEEFAVLKNMIPACTGEMHKLAILQASIEYVRYLEDCVASLKAHHEGGKQQQQKQQRQHHQHISSSPVGSQYDPAHHYPTAYKDGSTSPDVEMDDDDGFDGDDGDNADENLPSPSWDAAQPQSATSSSRSTTHQPSVSPALLAQDSQRRLQRQDSLSSTASVSAAAAAAEAAAIEHHRHYSYSASTQESPAFGPQPSYLYSTATASVAGLTLTSPALLPQRDLDQEATAALLMLNSDRRGSVISSNASSRGMSVRDLLST